MCATLLPASTAAPQSAALCETFAPPSRLKSKAAAGCSADSLPQLKVFTVRTHSHRCCPHSTIATSTHRVLPPNAHDIQAASATLTATRNLAVHACIPLDTNSHYAWTPTLIILPCSCPFPPPSQARLYLLRNFAIGQNCSGRQTRYDFQSPFFRPLSHLKSKAAAACSTG